MANQFINPYNFIPFQNKKSMYKENTQECLTGVIEYKVLTKTPLFIPNTSHEDVFQTQKQVEDHKSYDFYSYHDLSGLNQKLTAYYQPVIPGSEIRGMFRNNFEILTNSCMSALDTDQKLSKRTMEAFQAGLIKKVGNQYHLYAAQDTLLRTVKENCLEVDTNTERFRVKSYKQKDLKEGQKIKVKIRRRDPGKPLVERVVQPNSPLSKGAVDGYVLKGLPGPQGRNEKHCCHVFIEQNTLIKKDVKISLLEDVLKIYKDNTLANANAYTEYERQLKEFKAGMGEACFPVYYSSVGNGARQRVFLSPACFTREIYDNTLKSLSGEMAPCTKKTGYCEACMLFGTITDDDAKASKLRFTDLKSKEADSYKDYYLKPVTLKELSSPSLNNMEFYLQKPKSAAFWTYDYYVDMQGNLRVEQGKLAGRKFYWHQPLKDSALTDAEKTNRNQTVRPVKTGVEFTGKIYFRDISKNELHKLLYLVQAGDDGSIAEKTHGYKLGKAKPLGFGSIACEVEGVWLKEYGLEDGMVKQNINAYDVPYAEHVKELFAKDIVDNYSKMTDFHGVQLKDGEVFSYPKADVTDPEENGFKWYVENHKGVHHKDRQKMINMPNSREGMIFQYYLKAMEPCVVRVPGNWTQDSQRSGGSRNSGNGKGKKPGGYNKGKTNYKKRW